MRTQTVRCSILFECREDLARRLFPLFILFLCLSLKAHFGLYLNEISLSVYVVVVIIVGNKLDHGRVFISWRFRSHYIYLLFAIILVT